MINWRFLEELLPCLGQSYPGVYIEIDVPEEVYFLRSKIWIYLNSEDHRLDAETLLWCISRICQSGKTTDEALRLLQILPLEEERDV